MVNLSSKIIYKIQNDLLQSCAMSINKKRTTDTYNNLYRVVRRRLFNDIMRRTVYTRLNIEKNL